MHDRPQIEELTTESRASIIDVLADAFRDYPVFPYILKDVEGDIYERHLRLLIGFFADARLMRGWPVYGVCEGDQLAAVLLLSDPVFMPRPEPLNVVAEELRAEIGNEAMARLDAFDSALSGYMPESQTYFVGMIGVRPSDQGKGYGRLLMEHVAELSRARPESSGVTLTTELPKNITFYERLGYRILGSANVGDISTWLFMMDT